jgi:hypothetical protein
VESVTLLYRVDTITLTNGGAGQEAFILCDNVNAPSGLACEYDTSRTITAAKFVTDHAAAYVAGGVIVTSSGDNIIFTSNVLGAEFTGSTVIYSDPGELGGTVVLTNPAFTTATNPSVNWTHTTGDDEPLIQINTEDIKEQMSRARQVLDLPLRETERDTFLSLSGCLRDHINSYNGVTRIFGISRASYNARSRDYNVTLCEVIGDLNLDHENVTDHDDAVITDVYGNNVFVEI